MLHVRAHCASCFTVFSVAILASLGLASTGLGGEPPAAGGKTQALQMFDLLPAIFVENRGQWDAQVRYAFQGKGINVFFTDEGPVFEVFGGSADDEGGREAAVIRARFVGANKTSPEGLEAAAAKMNYYIGSDPAKWRSGIPAFQKVIYRNVYDGIDLHVWGRRTGLKYEFHVAPGADWEKIRIEYEGTSGLEVDESGALCVGTPLGEMVDDAPVAYQESASGRVAVECSYRLAGESSYGFEVSGGYDRTCTLVIDPEIEWGTYLGGSNSDYGGRGIAVDGSGNVWVTGETWSADLPTVGSSDTSYAGYNDAFVARVTALGELACVTYLGGSSNDIGASVAVDASGNAWVTGDTRSSDFPTPGGFDTSGGGGEVSSDAFIARVAPSGQLAWASYLGGTEPGYDSGRGIAIDASGNAWVTGYTDSADFPTPGGFDTSLGGGCDAFVARITPTGNLAFASYLGGNNWDAGVGIAIDVSGNAWVTGYTNSSDFPTPGGFDTNCDDYSVDAFVARITPAGELAFASYLGGFGPDQGGAIAIDTLGNAWVTGYTYSSDFPTPGGFDTSFAGCGEGPPDGFVARITPAGDLAFASYLGGSNYDYGTGIAIDAAGNAWVTGWTGSSDFPTPGGFDAGNDAFVARITPTGDLAFASYLGGSGEDYPCGIAIDASGNAWVTGETHSSDFPTPGGFDSSLGGDSDAFVAKIGPGNETPGEIAVYVSQSYDRVTNTLSLKARAYDPLYGNVTSGVFTWVLRAANLHTISSGTLAYDAATAEWQASSVITGGLAPGYYTVAYEINSAAGRTGRLLSGLVVPGPIVEVSGTIRDVSTGQALSGAEVALFEGTSFWALVINEYDRHVPPLATLLSRLTPLQGPVTTGADGEYGWTSLWPGGTCVVAADRSEYSVSHTTSFPLTAAASRIVRDLSLKPDTSNTLAYFGADVDEFYRASVAVLDYNAGLMGDLSAKAAADNLLGDPDLSSAYTDAAGWIAVLSPSSGIVGLSNAIGGVSIKTLAKHMVAQGALNAIRKLVKDSGKQYLDRVKDDLIKETFPLTKEAFRTSEYNTPFAEQILQAHSAFESEAGGIWLAAEFDREKAAQLLEERRAALEETCNGSAPFLVSPSPRDGIEPLALITMKRHYDELSKRHAVLGGAAVVLATVEIAGTAAAWMSLATGMGAPAAGAAATAASLSGWGKTIVQAEQIVLKLEMAYAFINSVAGTYPMDNGYVQQHHDEMLEFLKQEAASPYYLNQGHDFAADTKVNLNLLKFQDADFMFTLGWSALDWGIGTATVTVTNTGDVPAGIRTTAYGVWAPISVTWLLGLGARELTTCMSGYGPYELDAGASAEFGLPFTGHSRNFLSKFMPHYLKVDTFSGPWHRSQVIKPYYVIGLLENPADFIDLIGVFSARTRDLGRKSPATADSYLAAAVTRDGPMGMPQLMDQITQAGELVSASLSAANPTAGASFNIGADIYTADLRLFSPQGSPISILVTDSAGKRLGYSSAEGITYSEIVGGVTILAEQPVLLRLCEPPEGARYEVEIALLSPGPDDVPVSLFYEPVKRSGAIMTAFPSRVVIDGACGAEQYVSVYAGEASGQVPLTGVAGEMSSVTGAGGQQLPVEGDLHKTLGDLAAGSQSFASWKVVYPADARRGKYRGLVTLSSNETSQLNVPVIALVRGVTDTVSVYEGPEEAMSAVQKSLPLGADGKAYTSVHVPKGFHVVYGALGVVGASQALQDPTVDIGADGSVEWAFSGTFQLGVLLDEVEAAFNNYLAAHAPDADGWDVPIRVTGPPGETVLLNGIKLYLDTGGALSVSPSEGLCPTGVEGGPFTPNSKAYTLANAGDMPLDYQVSRTESWVSLSGAVSGTLQPQETADVMVSVHTDADSLPAGMYSDTVTFTNTTDGQGDTTRAIDLTVTGGEEIESLFVVRKLLIRRDLKRTGADRFMFSASINTTGTSVDWSAAPVKIQVGPYEQTLPAGAFVTKSGTKYTYVAPRGTKSGIIRAQIDLSKRTVTVSGMGLDLSGIGSDVAVGFKAGDFEGSCLVNIVPKYTFTYGTTGVILTNVFMIDKAKFTRNTKQANKDSFSISGAMYYTKALDLAAEEFTLTVGGQSWTLPAGSFKKSGKENLYKYKGVKGSQITSAQVDLTKGVFKISGANLSLDPLGDTVEISIEAGTFQGTATIGLRQAGASKVY